jgi:hypothetical protein
LPASQSEFHGSAELRPTGGNSGPIVGRAERWRSLFRRDAETNTRDARVLPNQILPRLTAAPTREGFVPAPGIQRDNFRPAHHPVPRELPGRW